MAVSADNRNKLLRSYLDTTVSMVRSNSPDLTDRQKTVLLKVYLHDESQTVRGLAAYCEISKPAITRALDRLAEFDFVRRKTDPLDRRSIIVQRTPAGLSFLRQIGDILVKSQSTKELT